MMAGLSNLRRPGPNGLTDVALGVVAVLLFAGAVVGFCFSLRITLQSHSALPLWDEWETAWDVRDAMTIGIGQVRLMAPHGEHTIALSRTLGILDGYLARGTNVLTIAAVWILTALFTWEVARIATPSSAARLASRVAVASALVLFLFQPRTLENLTWGFQTQFPAVYFFALLAFDVTGRMVETAGNPGSQSRLWLAGLGWLAAGLSAVSMGNGSIVALLCALIAFLGRAPRWYRIGSVIAAVLFLVPLVNLRSALIGGERSVADWSVEAAAPYLAALLSSPFAIVGMSKVQFVVLGLLVAVCVMGLWEIFRTPATALSGRWTQVVSASFLFASIVGIALARSNFSLESAYSGRYLLPVVAWWAVSLGLVVDVLWRRPWLRRISIASIAVGAAVGCSSIVAGAASEAAHYLQKGRDNQLAEAMILSRVFDDRLIKKIGAWPGGVDDFIQFFEKRKLGPFAYSTGEWKGRKVPALFGGAAIEDASNQCIVHAASPVFGNGEGLALHAWSWRPSAERSGWFRISGHCNWLGGDHFSGDVIFQGSDDRIAGLGLMWSSTIDRGRPDEETGSIERVEFEGYFESAVAQQIRVAVVDEQRTRVRMLTRVDVDPEKVGWRSATERAGLDGRIEGVTVNGRRLGDSECLPQTGPSTLRLSGWAMDLNAREPASAVMVVPEEGPRVYAGYGYPREDVARVFAAETATFVGWNVEMALTPGANRREGLAIEVLSGDGLGKKVLSPRLLECPDGPAR